MKEVAKWREENSNKKRKSLAHFDVIINDPRLLKFKIVVPGRLQTVFRVIAPFVLIYCTRPACDDDRWCPILQRITTTKTSPASPDFWLNRISQSVIRELRFSLCIVAPLWMQCPGSGVEETIGNRLTRTIAWNYLSSLQHSIDCHWTTLPFAWLTDDWTGMCVCVLGSERDWFVARLWKWKWTELTWPHDRMSCPACRGLMTKAP